MTAIAWAKYVGIGAAFVLQAWFWWHMGGQSTRLKVATAQVHTEVQAQQKDNHDRVTVAKEAKTYEAATDPLEPIAAPIVRMCIIPPAAPSVPSTHPAGSGDHAPAAVRDPDPAVPTIIEWHTEPLVRISHNADAQVIALQDYITHVCQGGTDATH